MIGIKPTCDRKTKFWSRQQNTFGLMPGKDGTCPGCTTGPKGCWYLAPGRKTHTCYVDTLMRCYSGIRGVLEHNTKLLMNASQTEMVKLLSAEFARFERDEARHHETTGEPMALTYRIHWSGDLFSPVYAQALSEAMMQHPLVNFWSYTRVFSSVPQVLRAKNLMQYLSLDPENVDKGLMAYDECSGADNPNLQLCYMSTSDDSEDAFEAAKLRVQAKDRIRSMLGLQKRGSAWCSAKLRECPVDTGKLPGEYGCSKCKRCLTAGSGSVWFKC